MSALAANRMVGGFQTVHARIFYDSSALLFPVIRAFLGGEYRERPYCVSMLNGPVAHGFITALSGSQIKPPALPEVDDAILY